uniref:hypothetical protein n=1 Tax=Faecalibacterium sp. TaxID=1971605 RepID=UPI004028C138
MKKDKSFRPDRVLSYFRVEWFPLLLVTLSGLVYNIGLLAAPWFEGRLAQCLADILGGSETAAQMALLVLAYIAVTLLVQAARFIKRFYVRRFANNINRRMKGILYANLVRQSRAALEKEGRRCGRLCGGNAQVHHGGVRHRCGAGGLCGHAAGVRLAAGDPGPAFYSRVLCLCGRDEKAGAACRCGL